MKNQKGTNNNHKMLCFDNRPSNSGPLKETKGLGECAKDTNNPGAKKEFCRRLLSTPKCNML